MGSEGKTDIPPFVVAAHELKSPLSLIRQMSLLLEDDTISPEIQKQTIERIYQTSERALRLTADLTRAYSLNDNTLFELEPINLQQLCRQVVSDLQPYAESKKREVQFRSPKKVSLVVSHPILLGRILTNFIDNALNYTFDNEKIQLSIQHMNKTKKIRLGVRDFGPAVSKNVITSLSQGLTIQNEAILARPDSSGLGLYISSRFAEMIYSEVGVIRHHNGVTFFVDVPISAQLNLFDEAK